MSLFASLLTGCPFFGCDNTPKTMVTIELTPEEYAYWAMDGSNAPTTTAAGTTTTTGGSTSTGETTTDGSTGTGEATTGGSTDASSTGASSGSTSGGPLSDQEVCAQVCMNRYPEGLESCSLMKGEDKVVVTCNGEFVDECIGGRRHACVASHGRGEGSEPAALWLAQAAHDEAASVQAFRALGRELAAHGAPADLLARIEAAAGDEVRHAAAVAMLARERGAAIARPEAVEVPVRGLLAIALENAIEGCVHETWAALVAAHQARHAEAASVRTIYRTIAADEARHAELAWAIDAWLSQRLDAVGRAEVAAARQAAARALAERLAARADAPELAELGLPPGRVASRLCAGLDAALWSRAA